MIEKVQIKNFKSIKDLSFNCSRINIFIGEPNTGKSNILEAIGILSLPYVGLSRIHEAVKKLIRFETSEQLFYDNQINEPVEIETNIAKIQISFNYSSRVFLFQLSSLNKKRLKIKMDLLLDGNLSNYQPNKILSFQSLIKFYRFVDDKKFKDLTPGPLIPPHGDNLSVCIRTNKEISDYVSSLLAGFGLKLNIKELENNIEISKLVDDVIISFPYSSLSDTLQRIIFYYTAIQSNKNTTLLLEEPEAHSFPFYTKELAEMIALDTNNNQYFISTHNPYFLLSVVEKAKKQDLSIFITYLKEYKTRLKKLTDDEVEELLDYASALFFNLDKFFPEK